MKENVKANIDKAIRKDKLNRFLILGFPEFLIIALVAVALVVFFPMGSESIEGKAYKLSSLQNASSNEKKMLVELGDGTIKTASMPDQMIFKAGERVELVETTGLAGSTKYRVVRYIK